MSFGSHRFIGPSLDPPDDEPPRPPRCHCGGFLPAKADRYETHEDAIDCDGTEKLEAIPYEDSTIAIIGEEFRGTTYSASFSACGPEKGEHAPHREVLYADRIAIWTCPRCGQEHREGGY
jgi:hypothetical protein